MMQFNTFRNLCKVADYLLVIEEESLTPATLWALGIPRSRNFISEMKQSLEQAEIIRRETRGYTAGKEYQRFTLVTQLYQSREDYDRPFEARIADHFEVSSDVRAYLYLLDKREATMSEIGASLDIPKATLSRALKALVADGLAIREPGEGRCDLFRSTGTFLNRAEYFEVYCRAEEEFYSSYCSIGEEEMGNGLRVNDLGEVLGCEGEGESVGDVSIYMGVPSRCCKKSADSPDPSPIQYVESRFRNQIGQQRFLAKPSAKEADLFLKGLDRRISDEILTKLRAINSYYDQRLTPDLFRLRFRWNYKYHQTKKTTTITKSTRMTHAQWSLTESRNKYQSQHQDKFYYPYLREHLGPNYQNLDIKAAVPRVNAAMNGLLHPREDDLYFTLAIHAANSHPAWKPIVEDFPAFRKAIKRLFMLFFFTGNGVNKARRACFADFRRQEKKKARYEKHLPPEEAAFRIAKEVVEIPTKLRELVGSKDTAAAFSASLNTALGKVYNREVFLVESLIEMDVLWHFISQGRCIVNNYDEFFFLDDISKEEVSQVIEERIRVRGAEFYAARHPVKKVRKGKGGKVTVETEELRKAS